MESITMANHEDHLTNSVQEVDTQEPDLGPVARSYECMFCRRGFTTAQALGGHMNIHRKDRAKGSRPSYLSNNNSNKQEDHSSYANPIFHHQVYTSYPQTHISKTRINQEGHTRYTTCLSSISSAAQLVDHENNYQDCCGVIKSPSRDEKMMTLSLESCDWSYGEDDRASTTRDRAGSDDDELDLELRLGHEPFKLQNSDGRPLFSSSQNVFLG